MDTLNAEQKVALEMQNLIKFYEKKIEGLRNALKAIGIDDNSKIVISGVNETGKSFEQSTLITKIIDILREKKEPMTSREIMNEINRIYNKKYILNGFSGQLSMAFKKANEKDWQSGLERIEFENNPNQYKVFYYLYEWKDENGKLKPEFNKRLEQYQ
jgi:ATPase subunit of ABC transporter with duplicated ATPase domains